MVAATLRRDLRRPLSAAQLTEEVVTIRLDSVCVRKSGTQSPFISPGAGHFVG